MKDNEIIVAQIPLKVGGIKENYNKIISTLHQADMSGAKLVIFPEMTLTGYPLEDLADSSDVRETTQKYLQKIEKRYANGDFKTAAIIGSLETIIESNQNRRAANSAYIFQQGKPLKRFIKTNLPNTGVFDEERNFLCSLEVSNYDNVNAPVVEIGDEKIGLMICHDMWETEKFPYTSFNGLDVDRIIVINGSPYEFQKQNTRIALASHLKNTTMKQKAEVIYVNRVGGQDEVIFDGQSFHISKTGEIKQFPPFVETIATLADMLPFNQVWPAQEGNNHYPETEDQLEELWNALVNGLRDYTYNCGFTKIVLGVSGGIDSALIGALAADSIGGENIIAVSMPSPYSSQGSLDDAKELADRHGMDYRVMPIGGLMNEFSQGYSLTGTAAENLQSRLRGLTLMSVSNQEGALTLACGNKTELAVGYSTIYGDSVGGYAPIKDIPKTIVWKLAKWRNNKAEENNEEKVIPESSITKPASAELAPDQKDEDDLPEYETLDGILDAFIRANKPYKEIISAYDKETVDRVIHLVKVAEWKRRQYPIGIKVTKLSFGKERRFPIVNKWSV